MAIYRPKIPISILRDDHARLGSIELTIQGRTGFILNHFEVVNILLDNVDIEVLVESAKKLRKNHEG